jgi:hypothetical protein
LAGPLPLGETAGTRAAQVAATPGSRRPAYCGVRSSRTQWLSLEPGVLSEAMDWMDRERACCGRLLDIVDEYLREARPR